MPDRSASEMSRPTASTSAISAPPALPSDMNTSKGCALSSSVIVTYIVPSGRRQGAALRSVHVVFRDRHVHRAEWRVQPARRAAQQLRPRTLGAPLQVLALGLM